MNNNKMTISWGTIVGLIYCVLVLWEVAVFDRYMGYIAFAGLIYLFKNN